MRSTVITKKCQTCNKEKPHRIDSKVCMNCEPKDPHVAEVAVASCEQCPFHHSDRQWGLFVHHFCTLLAGKGDSYSIHKNVIQPHKYKEMPTFCPMKGETKVFEWVYTNPQERIKSLTTEIEEIVAWMNKPDSK